MHLRNTEVRIETIAKCNSKCIMCPREKLTRNKGAMSYSHFERLAVEAKLLGAKTISLFGFGEPLMDTNLPEKVKLVSKLGMEPIITTNASLLTQTKTHSLLEAGLKQIRFSVHGLGKTYDLTHVGLNWHNTMRNINSFLDMNQGQCTTHVSVIPMHNEEIEEIKKFWGGDVDYIEIWRPHNWVYGRRYRKVKGRLKTCGRPSNGPIQINTDGTIMVCCFDFNGEMTIGDTWRASIKEILKSEKAVLVRRKHESGDLSGLPCETCDQLNIYGEDDYPLLYSNRDESKEINKTSSTKFGLI